MEEILKLFGGADNIWDAIKTNASKVGIEATRMMLELFYVLKSPNTGVVNKTLIIAALGYQLLPEDVMPRDKYGLLGMLDNGVTLAFAYKKVKSSITPQIEQQVDNVLRNWFNKYDNINDGSLRLNTEGNSEGSTYDPGKQPIWEISNNTDHFFSKRDTIKKGNEIEWDDIDIIID